MQLKKITLLLFLSVSALLGNEVSVTAYFPEDRIAECLIGVIDREQRSLKVAIYAITHRGIADAIIRAKDRGVAVEVLLDPFSVKNRAAIDKLLEKKVPLFVWDKGFRMRQEGMRKGLMHDKFCVFGGDKVWTGSFNFTYDASGCHRENALLIENRKIAQQYLTQFSKMQLHESCPYHEFLALYPKKKRQKKGAAVKIGS